MGTRILSPHDEFFKEIFGDLDRARDFLRVLRYRFRRSVTTAREALALNLHPEMREQVMTMEEEAIQRGVEKGLQEGLRQKALEDARRMRDHGITWEIVTDVTGIVPADLG